MSQVQLFFHACKSQKTAQLYLWNLTVFQQATNIKSLQTAKPKDLQAKIIEYLISMKEAGKSYSFRNTMVCALQKYCEVYDIEVNFKKVRKFMGENTTSHSDLLCSPEQITKIEVADPRMKAIILTMLSSGCRVGSFNTLRIGDIKKVDTGIYQLRIYSDSPKHAYTTFTTPEATKAIDVYLEWRKNVGEELKPSSPLFRKEFNINKPNEVIEPLATKALYQAVYKFLVSNGIRVVNSKGKRQDTMLTHSFRKFANTAFVKAGIKPVVVEMLLGHNTGLQKNYLRLTDGDVSGIFESSRFAYRE